MIEAASRVEALTDVVIAGDTPRHAALVRVTHWLTAACFLALLISGFLLVRRGRSPVRSRTCGLPATDTTASRTRPATACAWIR